MEVSHPTSGHDLQSPEFLQAGSDTDMHQFHIVPRKRCLLLDPDLRVHEIRGIPGAQIKISVAQSVQPYGPHLGRNWSLTPRFMAHARPNQGLPRFTPAAETCCDTEPSPCKVVTKKYDPVSAVGGSSEQTSLCIMRGCLIREYNY